MVLQIEKRHEEGCGGRDGSGTCLVEWKGSAARFVAWLVVYNLICFLTRVPDCKLLKAGELVF